MKKNSKILSMFLALIIMLTITTSTNQSIVMAAETATPTITNSTFSGTLAIKKDGSLWLLNGSYDGKRTHLELEPIKIMNNVASVSSGGYSSFHMILKTDGSVWMWGDNHDGQLGDGTTKERTKAVKIMDDVIFISAGWDHSTAIKKDGSLWVWGDNSYGQIGDGTITTWNKKGGKIIKNNDRKKPVKVMDNVTFVNANGNRTMAVKADGSLWDWGERNSISWTDPNSSPDKRNFKKPVKVMDDVVSVSATGTPLALKTDGSVWAVELGYAPRSDGKVDVGEYFTWVYYDKAETPTTSLKIMDGVASISGDMILKTDSSLWTWSCDWGSVGTFAKVMDDVAAMTPSVSFGWPVVLKTNGDLFRFHEIYQISGYNKPILTMKGVKLPKAIKVVKAVKQVTVAKNR